MSGFIAVGYFLISLVFSSILFALWARIALRYLRVSSLNSFNRLIGVLTNPLIIPLHRLVRYKNQASKRYDWPAVTAIILVELLKITLLSLLTYHRMLPLISMSVYILADLMAQPFNLLFYAILVRVVMSYANPLWNHPLNDFLTLLTNPLLVLGRHLIPDISGFDFSPFVMMVLLKVIALFIYSSLPIPL
jgi:YggT family protein